MYKQKNKKKTNVFSISFFVEVRLIIKLPLVLSGSGSNLELAAYLYNGAYYYAMAGFIQDILRHFHCTDMDYSFQAWMTYAAQSFGTITIAQSQSTISSSRL